jgi:thioredoxin reductase
VTAITNGADGRQAIVFDDESTETCDAVFVSAPLRQRYPLVDMLGCRVRDDGEIDVDARGRTSVTGCYAAGDAVTTIHQVVLAAASGVCAAMGINEDLVAEEVEATLRSTGAERP